MDAFDAGVLITAAADQPLGRHVRALFDASDPAAPAGVGSVLILADLARPLRDCSDASILALRALLRRIDLRPVDDTTADLATALAAKYDLTALAAVHLATAVVTRVDRFLTTNMREYSRSITEVEIVTPADLARAERTRHAHGPRVSRRFIGARH